MCYSDVNPRSHRLPGPCGARTCINDKNTAPHDVAMRKYDLVCFDMDGVLTDIRSSWCWIHRCLDVDNEESYRLFCEGAIDEPEFIMRDVSLWKTVEPRIGHRDLIRHFRSIPLIGGIQETVACLKGNGMKCVIISGGIDIAARMIAAEFGFDDSQAVELVADDEGVLTGEGIRHVKLSDKGGNVRYFTEKYGTTRERTVSIGNSFTDIPMFENSGMSIAFNPVDPCTEAAATHVVRSDNISDVLDHILEETCPVR